MNSYGMYYKRFVSGTGYLNGGLEYRSLKYDYSADGKSVKFSANVISFNAFAGTQWSWTNFTMGCDWIGVRVPVIKSLSDESISPVSQETKDRLDSEETSYVSSLSLELLHF